MGERDPRGASEEDPLGLGSEKEGALTRNLAPFLAALAIPGFSLTWLSCRTAEHELIDRFFEASLRQDNETVAALSMVAFPAEPTAWKVIDISDEIREPYRVPAMRERVEEADERRDEQFKLFGEFRQANYDDLAHIQRELRDDTDRNLPPCLAELQRRWEAFREERRAVLASLREAEQSLEWEIRCIHKSLQREASAERLTGETLNKEARVRVTKAEGEGLYVVTLTRYDVRNEFEAVIPTRWIITGIEPEIE